MPRCVETEDEINMIEDYEAEDGFGGFYKF